VLQHVASHGRFHRLSMWGSLRESSKLAPMWRSWCNLWGQATTNAPDGESCEVLLAHLCRVGVSLFVCLRRRSTELLHTQADSCRLLRRFCFTFVGRDLKAG
jgi:hypothetical protein